MVKRSVWLCTLLLAAGILLPSGCATVPTAGTDADAAAVKAVLEEYGKAAEAGDAERFLALWMENGVKMSPNTPQLIGKEPLRKKTVAGFQAGRTHMVMDLQEVLVRGDLAIARGLYTKDTTPTAGGATTHFDGKFLTVFRKQADGTWKIYIDSPNSNTP